MQKISVNKRKIEHHWTNKTGVTWSFSTFSFLMLVPVRSRTVSLGQRSYGKIKEGSGCQSCVELNKLNDETKYGVIIYSLRLYKGIQLSARGLETEWIQYVDTMYWMVNTFLTSRDNLRMVFLRKETQDDHGVIQTWMIGRTCSPPSRPQFIKHSSSNWLPSRLVRRWRHEMSICWMQDSSMDQYFSKRLNWIRRRPIFSQFNLR